MLVKIELEQPDGPNGSQRMPLTYVLDVADLEHGDFERRFGLCFEGEPPALAGIRVTLVSGLR